MLNALKVRMVELPQDRVLPLVPHHTGCPCIPPNGWCFSEAMRETAVRELVTTIERAIDRDDLEVLGMNVERWTPYVVSGTLLGDLPLGAQPLGHLRRSRKRSIATSQEQGQNEEV